MNIDLSSRLLRSIMIYEGIPEATKDQAPHTLPKNAGSDGDGCSEGLEAQWKTDPAYPNLKNELIRQLPLIFGISGGIIFIITLSKFIRKRNFNKK